MPSPAATQGVDSSISGIWEEELVGTPPNVVDDMLDGPNESDGGGGWTPPHGGNDPSVSRLVESRSCTMTQDHHVWILTMGGTIDKDYPCVTLGYAFEFGEESAASRILKQHPNLGITYDVIRICQKDSQDMDDTDRQRLMMEIRRIMNTNVDPRFGRIRIVVTHGTDTMIETAQFVQEQLKSRHPRTQVSIVFTGATKPERFVDSDAAFNLGSAISVTGWDGEGVSSWVVMICMNGNVISANHCQRLENGVFCCKE